MKKIFYLVLMLIIPMFTSYGCFNNQEFVATKTQATKTREIAQKTPLDETLTATITPTSFPTPTVTPSPTRTFIFNETKVPTPMNAAFSNKCIEIYSSLPSEPDIHIQGALYLERNISPYHYFAHYVNYLIDFDNQESYLASDPEELRFYPITSPDHTKFAYHHYEIPLPHGNLTISNSMDKEILTIPWDDDWVSLITWLDDENIVIRLIDTEINGHRFLILNPFTMEQTILMPDFPKMYEHWLQDWQGWKNSVYNTELDRALYLRDDFAFQYVLWDTISSQEITAINFVDSPSQIPRWSSEEEVFYLAYSIISEDQDMWDWPAFELFRIDRDGIITQLTNLNDYFNWVSISDYSISPDESAIAFWFSSGVEEKADVPKNHEEYLAVLNRESGVVTNYCIPGDYNPYVGERSWMVPAPLWSPDGKQLVIVNRYDEENHNRVILVDLEKEQAYQIAENAIPLAWLLANP